MATNNVTQQLIEEAKRFNKHVTALIESHSLALSMTDPEKQAAALRYLNARLNRLLNGSQS